MHGADPRAEVEGPATRLSSSSLVVVLLEQPSGWSPDKIALTLSSRARKLLFAFVCECLRTGIAEDAMAIRIGTAADDPAVAEHDERAPRPRTLKSGREKVERHGIISW